MTQDELMESDERDAGAEDYTTDPLDRALQQFLGKDTNEIRMTIKATLEVSLHLLVFVFMRAIVLLKLDCAGLVCVFVFSLFVFVFVS
jgi:hypothetical protein